MQGSTPPEDRPCLLPPKDGYREFGDYVVREVFEQTGYA